MSWTRSMKGVADVADVADVLAGQLDTCCADASAGRRVQSLALPRRRLMI
ncbi:MAG: hypothetical protein ACR2H3_04315 [Acidimicrobiales bacterium]